MWYGTKQTMLDSGVQALLGAKPLFANIYILQQQQKYEKTKYETHNLASCRPFFIMVFALAE